MTIAMGMGVEYLGNIELLTRKLPASDVESIKTAVRNKNLTVTDIIDGVQAELSFTDGDHHHFIYVMLDEVRQI